MLSTFHILSVAYQALVGESELLCSEVSDLSSRTHTSMAIRSLFQCRALQMGDMSRQLDLSVCASQKNDLKMELLAHQHSRP